MAGRSTRTKGRAVEDRVARQARARGLKVIDRNSEGAGAEIDLVAQTDRGEHTIVFIEVRSRASADRGTPLETVGADKRRRIIRAATAWLTRKDLWERVAVRFDVVGVTGDEVEWLEDAFGEN